MNDFSEEYKDRELEEDIHEDDPVDIDSILRKIAGAKSEDKELTVAIPREAAEVIAAIAGQAGMWRDACRKLSKDIASLHERDASLSSIAALKCLVEKLLPELEHFERAFANVGNWPDKDIISGLALSFERMLGVLTDLGLERVETVGKPFNVRLHEAVEAVESDEAPNTVLKEVEPGWQFRGELLRAAKVVVSVKRRGEREY
ncbi:MAG: nucleotide exchange factor GrpE [Planctomycetota bacterium]